MFSASCMAQGVGQREGGAGPRALMSAWKQSLPGSEHPVWLPADTGSGAG